MRTGRGRSVARRGDRAEQPMKRRCRQSWTGIPCVLPKRAGEHGEMALLQRTGIGGERVEWEKERLLCHVCVWVHACESRVLVFM